MTRAARDEGHLVAATLAAAERLLTEVGWPADPGGHGLRAFLETLAGAGVLGVMLDGDDEDPGRVRVAQRLTESVVLRSPSLAMLVGAIRIQSVMLARAERGAERDARLARALAGREIGSIAVSEPGAGTDIPGMRTVLSTDSGGGGSLTGSKAWVALAPVADFALVLAKREGEGRDADMAVVVVDRDDEGVTFTDAAPLMGYGDLPIGGVAFDAVRVGPERVIVQHGGLKAFLGVVNFARIEAASHGVALLTACVDECVQRLREPVRNGRPLGEFQKAQDLLGSMRIDLEAARGLRDRAAAGYADGEADPVLCAAAKVFAADRAAEHTARGVGLFGAAGLTQGARIGQLFRDAKGAQTFDGMTDILQLMVGRETARSWHRSDPR